LSEKYVRIPFEEAISERLLFKKPFEKLSPPQQMVLKSIYGLSLSKEEKRLWDAFNGFGEYDELGQLVGTNGEFPYHGVEMEDVTLIIGRRGAKTSAISSFIAAYEALCGGHKAYVAEKQDAIILQVAQDLNTARANVRQFILDILQQSPIGERELGSLQASVTADQIRLKTLGTLITVGPPTIKLRGQAIACCLMDELAVWPKDKEAAQPDYEVERAVRPAMSQFPFRKMVKTSSPWTEEGLLWDAAQMGTYGVKGKEPSPRMLVLNAPTAAMKNPKVPLEYLQQERTKDVNAFRREYLAEFAQSVSGFLSHTAIRAALLPTERLKKKPGVLYVCTIDPAFRKDAFAYCIGHLEHDGTFILDFTGQWRGTHDKPLSPSFAMASLAVFCREYGIRHMVSDQYHDVTLQDLALQYGISLESMYLNAKVKKQIWGDVAAMLNLGRIKMVKHAELTDQLLKLEQHLTPFGNYQFYGKRDDMAHAFAMCVHRALQYGVRALMTSDEGKVIMTFQEERDRSRQKMGMKKQENPWFA